MASVGNALLVHEDFPLTGARNGRLLVCPSSSRPGLGRFPPHDWGVQEPSGSGCVPCSGRNLSIKGGIHWPKRGCWWSGIVWLMLAVSLVGCRTNPQVALLELENRLLEDRIYQLEAQLAKQAQQLAACRQQMGIPVPAESRAVIPPKEGTPSTSAPGVGSPAMSSPGPGPGIYPSPTSPTKEGGKDSQNRGRSPVEIYIPSEPLPPGVSPFSGRQPAEQAVPPPGPQLNNPATSGYTPGPSGNTPGGSGPPAGPAGHTPGTAPANPPPALSGNPPPAPSSSSPAGSKEPERPSSGSPAGGIAATPGRMPTSLSAGLSPAAFAGSAAPLATTGWTVGDWSSRAQQIQILPALTGPYNADGQPGDEGITVGLQPVDEQGGLVPAAAPISLVVIDPAIADESARVARWDLSAEQIAGFTQNLPQGQPLRLVLVWPSGPPRHNRLHLFVRYITADGRKLQADMPLQVDVEGRQIALLSGGGPAGQATAQPGQSAASSALEHPLPANPFGHSSASPYGQTPIGGHSLGSWASGQPRGEGSGGAGSANLYPSGPLASDASPGGSNPLRASSPPEGLVSDSAAGPLPIRPTPTPSTESPGRRPRIPWQPTR